MHFKGNKSEEDQHKKISLSHMVKCKDMFGHKIEFNWDDKHSNHNTVIGGAFSIVLMILMLILVGFRSM